MLFRSPFFQAHGILAQHAARKDAMRLKEWRSGDDSVFVARDHKYGPEDLQNPY